MISSLITGEATKFHSNKVKSSNLYAIQEDLENDTSLCPPLLLCGAVSEVLECGLVLLSPKDWNIETHEVHPKINRKGTAPYDGQMCVSTWGERERERESHTWWGRSEFKRWCKFLNTREISSTLLAYCDGLSIRISASSKICSCKSPLSVLSSFLKSVEDYHL